jgi:HKD family nuclease
MRIIILGPAPAANRLTPFGRYLKNQLNKIKVKESLFRFAVAYAQESYEPLLGKALRSYVKKGGTVEAVIGVDSRGTSAKALKEILGICGPSSVFVYHNPADGTFHPKFYILSDKQSALAIVGSSNLTVGGIANNFEVSTAIELDLESEEDVPIFNSFDKLFKGIKGSPSCRLLDMSFLEELKATGALRGRATTQPESTISNTSRKQLREYFGFTPHKGIRVKPRRIKKHPRFVMSLVENDVSGKRGEPYFLVPIKARDQNPSFWGWRSNFSPSPKGKFPERLFRAKVNIEGNQTFENCRLYFFEGRDEFRLKCEPIYRLGRAYAGSFVVISWAREHNETIAMISMIPKGDQQYERLAKLPLEVHAMGKRWTYD